MSTKHTPGPWTASGPSELNGRFSVYHNGPLIYCDNEADARLIAAAPDLLAALESALPALIRLGDFVGNVDLGGASNQGRIDRCALILQARAAIAKATGEQ